MHKGMWSSYLYELSPEEAIREFARKGWRHLELSTEHGAALLERGEPAQVGEQFRRFCAHLEVALPQGHLRLRADIALPDGDSRRREIDDLKRWIELFSSLGIQAGVLHPGGQSRHDPTRTPDEVFRIVAESLRELVAHARGTPNAAKVAMNDLKALINQMEAQTDKKIDPDTAAEIIERAERIIAQLGG